MRRRRWPCRGLSVCWIFPRRPLPSGFLPLGGVAVIAGNTWAAMQGRQSLQIQWEPGPNADYNTTAYRTGRPRGSRARWRGRTVTWTSRCRLPPSAQRGLLRATSRAHDDGAGIVHRSVRRRRVHGMGGDTEPAAGARHPSRRYSASRNRHYGPRHAAWGRFRAEVRTTSPRRRCWRAQSALR